jgi:5-methylcytosine-specific restriction enzyme A
VTSRRSLSPLQRERIFLANGGVCHLCGRKIRAGEPWDVSHDRPLALLGEDGGDNLKVAHRACHAIQTREQDAPRIAKAKRQSAKHLGIRKASRMAGSRDSRFKKHIDGRVSIR